MDWMRCGPEAACCTEAISLRGGQAVCSGVQLSPGELPHPLYLNVVSQQPAD